MPEIYSATNEKTEKPTKRQPGEYSAVMNTSTPTKNRWSSLMIRPTHACLSIMHRDERILMIIRSHPITQIGWVLIAILLMFVPFLSTFLPITPILPSRFESATLLLWYLFITSYIIDGFLGWYYNVFVITDERIIDVDFIHLVYKNITATKIDNIEDVTFSVSGFIPSLLNYGNVLIQTAGAVVVMQPDETKPTIEIYGAPQPSKVSKLINELMLEEEQEKIEGRTH